MDEPSVSSCRRGHQPPKGAGVKSFGAERENLYEDAKGNAQWAQPRGGKPMFHVGAG